MRTSRKVKLCYLKQRSRKSKENSDQLIIEAIGEVLIKRIVTPAQINNLLGIKNGRLVLAELLDSDFIEEIPDSDPKAYRIKDKPEQWMEGYEKSN